MAAAAAAAATTKLSSQSPPFNPNRILKRDRSSSPVPPHLVSSYNNNNNHNNHHNHHYGSRSRSTSPSNGSSSQGGGVGGTHRIVSSNGSSGGSKYPTNPNSAHSNAIMKHTFEYNGETLEIRNVWAENVEEEMRRIREVVERYPYVSMDTEFPGVVAKPVAESYKADYHYKSLKVNVDLLKIIQLGLVFSDEHGNLGSANDADDNIRKNSNDGKAAEGGGGGKGNGAGGSCWQFNFAFDLDDDMFAQDSIDLLVHSGISFPDHATRGIDPQLFGELMMVSGLVLDDRVKWVTYHAGYDFAYLLKLLTTQELPADEKAFFELLKVYFPTIYDIKYMTSVCDGRRFVGGLQRLADELGCRRLGSEHQAGSDSLLTKDAFFALAKNQFLNNGGGDNNNNENSNSGNSSSGGGGNNNNNAMTNNNNNNNSNNNNNGNSEEKKTTAGASSSSTSSCWFDDSRFANELYGYGSNHTVRKGPLHVREVSNISTTGSSPDLQYPNC